MRTALALLASLTLVAVASPASAQQPPPVRVPPLPLLEGRVFVTLPVGGRIDSSPPPNGQPMPPAKDETRAVFESGGVHFTTIAVELYESAGPDLQAAVAKIAEGESPTPVAVKSGLKIVGFAPVHAAPPSDETLLYAAFVEHPDGHVIQLGFFVDQMGLRNRPGWLTFAQGVLQTIAPGQRKLELKGGERTFPGIGADRLAVTLPAGWVENTDHGPDFAVHHLRKVEPLASPTPSCGIYLGNHPSAMHTRLNVAPTQTVGTLLGQKADWFTFKGPQGETTTEAIVTHPLNLAMSLHVFCTGGDDAQLKTMRAMIDTLHVVK